MSSEFTLIVPLLTLPDIFIVAQHKAGTGGDRDTVEATHLPQPTGCRCRYVGDPGYQRDRCSHRPKNYFNHTKHPFKLNPHDIDHLQWQFFVVSVEKMYRNVSVITDYFVTVVKIGSSISSVLRDASLLCLPTLEENRSPVGRPVFKTGEGR